MSDRPLTITEIASASACIAEADAEATARRFLRDLATNGKLPSTASVIEMSLACFKSSQADGIGEYANVATLAATAYILGRELERHRWGKTLA